jgi:hypothetical protein
MKRYAKHASADTLEVLNSTILPRVFATDSNHQYYRVPWWSNQNEIVNILNKLGFSAYKVSGLPFIIVNR